VQLAGERVADLADPFAIAIHHAERLRTIRIAEVVTGTLITDSPNRGTLPRSSLTPVAKVFPARPA
jgi:hypothetical protein